MERNDLEVTRMSHFVGIGLVLGFLLPRFSTVLLLVYPLLCLFYQCFRQNRIFYRNNLIVIIPVFFTLIINVSQGVTTKSVLSCITILLYFFCFPIVGKVKIPNFYLYLILSVILLSQLIYVFKISFLVDIMNKYYPISEKNVEYFRHMRNNISFDNYTHFRLGGLYRNPNQCARFVTFLLASFLVLNNEKPIRKLLPFIIVSFYSVLLTGSRTGFVVASMIIIAFLFVEKRLTPAWRFGIILAAFVGFLYLSIADVGSYRGLDVTSTGSSDYKFKTFAYYLSIENSSFRIMFGYLDSDKFESTVDVLNFFDADYGYLIFQFGFVGFIAVLSHFFSVYLRMDKIGRVFLVNLLWMITSTIVTSFQAFFVFMLLLSVIFNNNNLNNVRT